MSNQKVANPDLVAYCGIYCGSCKKYRIGKCPGCKENGKASWCKVRSCNIENSFKSCAECNLYQNPDNCKKFNNIFSKFFKLIFRSDRKASIYRIKEIGRREYAKEMCERDEMVIKGKRF